GTGADVKDELLAYLEQLGNRGWDLGLERMRLLLGLLGHPEEALSWVHVAGTNGKGSTSALIAAALQGAGLRVGFYTSPHLERYEERMVLLEGRERRPGLWGWPGAQEIAAEEFRALLGEIKPAAEEVERRLGRGAPTEFEVLTAAAFLFFARSGAQIGVAEVGLGGRLDATNVLRPQVSVITHVALDHQDRLGSTIAEIAREKAGIIKEGRPVVVAPQSREVAGILAEVARERRAPVEWVVPAGAAEVPGQAGGGPEGRRGLEAGGRSWFTPLAVDAAGGRFLFTGRLGRELELRVRLLGEHQIANAATAAAAAGLLAEQGWPLDVEALRWGLGAVHWPGRLELIEGEPPVLLDGAHNPDGVSTLVAALGRLFPRRRAVAVVGILKDKDVKEMVRLLAPVVGAAVCTRPPSPRAAEPEQLAGAFAACGCPARAAEEPREALELARKLAGAQGLVCVCGSLYLVGAVRPLLVGGKK
ncbi:MAG: folylpolyglutamate synthase/dihydrofolate synthase family protein, partial [Bacillota bacterium]|nr:folylpolyglutamate synthase/dihydrofolate synthase family protein [Bacillota bacterium]